MRRGVDVNIRAARWALEVDTVKVPPIARHVLLVLACHVPTGGDCAWPSMACLTAETGWNRTTILRSLDALEAAGLLEVARRNGARNTYKLSTDQSLWSSGPESKTSRSQEKTSRSQNKTSRSRHREGFRRNNKGGAADTTDPVRTVDNGRATFLPGTGWINER